MKPDKSEYLAASMSVHKGPCIVKNVHMAADGANGDCQVYDGENAKGTLKAHLEALSGTGDDWTPGSGTDFENGIYIVVNATTTKVTVTYEPESRKDFE